MVRLLLKIFLAYWLAAGIVIAISDLEPHRQIHTPELMDALNSAMTINGNVIVNAYEHGQCSYMQTELSSLPDALYLADQQGHILCGGNDRPDVQRLVALTVHDNKRTTENHARFQIIAVPTTSQSGAKYILLLKNSYSSALHLYGLLPGYTTIAISCIVTLFLALLMALPIRRLRAAAGQIAIGRLDARVRWGQMLRNPLKYGGGDDIDLLVRDFNYMAERLQQLANAQRVLLRDVSHELRSPLTRLGVALTLAKPEAHAGMEEHLDRIGVEAARLNSLIAQILSLSQMEMVHEIDMAKTVCLSELVAGILPDVKYEAVRSQCAISTSLSTDCYVRGDAELLRAAVENIIRNAIKYGSETCEIHIETTIAEREGVWLNTISVSDNGPGIPEHELCSVLKPFYRADRAKNWMRDGSGIGLAIADRAAKLHGGAIHLRNKVSGGLTVELSIPAEGIV